MATRNRRAGVEDRWHRRRCATSTATRKPCPSSQYGGNRMRWRARYVDERGREHTQAFARKVDAQRWLDQTDGGRSYRRTHVAPRDAQLTVAAVVRPVDRGIQGQPRIHGAPGTHPYPPDRRDEFGGMPLSAVRPSHKSRLWTAKLRADGMEAVLRLRAAFAAVADHVGRCARRRTRPQSVLAADLAPDGQGARCTSRPPNRSGRFTTRCRTTCGSRCCWARSPGCASPRSPALRVSDVDFIRGVVHPKQQWPDKPLQDRGQRSADPDPARPGAAAVGVSAAVPVAK